MICKLLLSQSRLDERSQSDSLLIWNQNLQSSFVPHPSHDLPKLYGFEEWHQKHCKKNSYVIFSTEVSGTP